ncbi:unnamed protein product, partial [Amoebophrya sp. A25]
VDDSVGEATSKKNLPEHDVRGVYHRLQVAPLPETSQQVDPKASAKQEGSTAQQQGQQQAPAASSAATTRVKKEEPSSTT